MPPTNWVVREMRADELDAICDIDVSEIGHVVYYWINGEAKPVTEYWQRPNRSFEQWQPILKGLRETLTTGGCAIGAFADGRIVGAVVLRNRLADDVALLHGLWVSENWRRKGIAKSIVTHGLDLVRQTGAKRVYVSATPSESAQGFYRTIGFMPTVWVHQEMFKQEPADIHMMMTL